MLRQRADIPIPQELFADILWIIADLRGIRSALMFPGIAGASVRHLVLRTPEMGLLPADNAEAERPGPFALAPGERAGKFRAHFESAESHASASSNEKEYSWSGTPERILAPSAMFTM